MEALGCPGFGGVGWLDHPHVAILGRSPDGTVYRDIAEQSGFTAVPGALIYRLDAPLIFTNADFFLDDLTERSRVRRRPTSV